MNLLDKCRFHKKLETETGDKNKEKYQNSAWGRIFFQLTKNI